MDNVKWDARELAERYDLVSDSQYERGLKLMDKMNIKSGSHVLDVGCGTGRMALHVADIVGPSGTVAGIDPSPHRIRVAENKLKGGAYPNVKLSVGRAEDLSDFSGGLFDVVYYCSVFHWVTDKKSALLEANRVLKRGGIVGLTTGERDNPSGIRSIRNQVLSRKPYAGKVKVDEDASKPVNKKEMETLFTTADFKDIKIEVATVKRHFSSARELLEFSEASSFGTYLKHVPEELRPDVTRDIKEEVEKIRTPAGIEFLTHTMYATAVKP